MSDTVHKTLSNMMHEWKKELESGVWQAIDEKEDNHNSKDVNITTVDGERTEIVNKMKKVVTTYSFVKA